jgi:serine/threonine-protein kinase
VSTTADVARARGARVGAYVVTGAVAERRDAAVVQARARSGTFVALKFPTSLLGEELASHEQAALSALSRFAERVADDGVSYLVTDWIAGSDARVAAAGLLERRTLLDLCRQIASAYAAIHLRGVVHGQVHPRHVLIDHDGSATVIDFSVATAGDVAPPPARLEARFNSLSAPEHARALLAARTLRPSCAAEQFSVAALLYLLVTGRMYSRLRLARDVLPADIAAASPLPFAAHGVEPWPALESALGRALSSDPSKRYRSTAEFVTALEAIEAPAPSARLPARSALSRALEEFKREACTAESIRRLSPPTCSINFGAAGVAYALIRLANLTGEPRLLEHAERWLCAAETRSGDADAFDDGDQLTAATTGAVSPFHTVSGLAVARALLSEATGDLGRWRSALAEYRLATAKPSENLDLTLGRASVLLVAALLIDRADRTWPESRQLVVYGDEVCDGIWRHAPTTPIAYNGIAHGWAGLAYASLMWSRARGAEPPPEVRQVLDGLAALAEPWAGGARWPVSTGSESPTDEFWPGWCHGNAGYVFLWDVAASVYGDPAFEALAERAAQLVNGGTGVSSLCCGDAGQAYALLSRRRAGGDDRWLVRAAHIAEGSAATGSLASDAPSPISLYKGHTGLALLAVELEQPDRAAMPLFEFERCASEIVG